jgi:uncharacterized protein
VRSFSSRRNIFLGGIIALMAALIFVWAQTGAPPAPAFPHDSLVIARADGQKFTLDVEIATTHAQTEYGLMFRRSLPKDSGMLFLFAPDQPTSFWMKNTYIPLDMLFVGADGTIEKIVTHAEPLNLAPIPSDEPVRGVIEINGGEADRRGLKTGDRVLYPAFTGR